MRLKLEKPRLIPNWRVAWKMFSVQIPTLNTAIIATWAAIPSKFQDAFPVTWLLGTVAFLIVLGVVGRLVAQPEVKP